MLAGLRLVSALFYILLLTLFYTADALAVPQDASLITLPLARRLNMTGAANIVKLDQARAKALREGLNVDVGASAFEKAFNVPAENQAVTYVANVGVGTPPTQYSLIIDTGSSNTWVGASKPYVITPSTVLTGQAVSVTYGSGAFVGLEYNDTVTLGNTKITNQGIGGALLSRGFTGVDGILGIGPVDLTCGTLFLSTQCIPTVTDNAFRQGLITAEQIGISFVPTTVPDKTDGELTFGGVDVSKFIAPITYVPITTTSPASKYVGINQTVTYGSARSPVLSMTAGITDTGTTLVLLASDAFARYQALTSAVLDTATGLLRITPAQYANLQSLYFTIGGRTYEFTANAQIFPRALNTAIGGQPGNIYLIVNNIGTSTGQGLDFIDGFAFLQRFYQVYDVTNSRVGFATTQFTHAMTN